MLFLIAWETCTLSTRRLGLALEYSTLFSFLTIGRWQEGGEINERKERIEKEYFLRFFFPLTALSMVSCEKERNH